MNHKKSMRIFWLSLCLLLLSGVIIITVVQIKSRENEKLKNDQAQSLENLQQSDTQENTLAQEDYHENTNNPNTRMREQSKSEDAAAQTQPTLSDPVTYLYELRVKNGYLEVYYYQTEQLFFHTGIPYHVLTENQRQQLEEGKYFQNEQELYGYLESCTS